MVSKINKAELDLTEKYRPRRFSELIGQERAIEFLKKHILNGTAYGLHYLISGETGTGKTSLARILTAALSCPERKDDQIDGCGMCSICECILWRQESSIDYEELNAADMSGVDMVREWRNQAQYLPIGGAKIKIFVVDEAHKLSEEAKSAFLKLLEMNLSSLFVFATTEPQKMLLAQKRRLTPIKLFKVSDDEILNHLAHICNFESMEYDPANLVLIAKMAKGLMGNALRLLNSHRSELQGNELRADLLREVLEGMSQDFLGLSKNEISILRAIWKNGQGCQLSYYDLEKESDIKNRTIKNLVPDLEKKKMLRVNREVVPNQYWILLGGDLKV